MKKPSKLPPLLYCQCLQASLFVYAILWLYSISVCDGSPSQQKINPKPKSKKVKQKLSQKPKLPKVCSSNLM